MLVINKNIKRFSHIPCTSHVVVVTSSSRRTPSPQPHSLVVTFGQTTAGAAHKNADRWPRVGLRRRRSRSRTDLLLGRIHLLHASTLEEEKEALQKLRLQEQQGHRPGIEALGKAEEARGVLEVDGREDKDQRRSAVFDLHCGAKNCRGRTWKGLRGAGRQREPLHPKDGAADKPSLYRFSMEESVWRNVDDPPLLQAEDSTVQPVVSTGVEFKAPYDDKRYLPFPWNIWGFSGENTPIIPATRKEGDEGRGSEMAKSQNVRRLSKATVNFEEFIYSDEFPNVVPLKKPKPTTKDTKKPRKTDLRRMLMTFVRQEARRRKQQLLDSVVKELGGLPDF
ncbi:hypothetical protein L596_000495 [Steinernema carpocapsae]|uniref:Uncharacterized protein n=1 Tax=Steinernema carpocapsae TaxID=34508 RepID=A0A4U8UKN0_STECR|nr:hypothetical protein L596_000495 [Steinernema carpocapsae]